MMLQISGLAPPRMSERREAASRLYHESLSTVCSFRPRLLDLGSGLDEQK